MIELILRPVNFVLSLTLFVLITRRLVAQWRILAPDLQLATASFALFPLLVAFGTFSVIAEWPAAPRIVFTTAACAWGLVAFLLPKKWRQFPSRRHDDHEGSSP